MQTVCLEYFVFCEVVIDTRKGSKIRERRRRTVCNSRETVWFLGEAVRKVQRIYLRKIEAATYNLLW